MKRAGMVLALSMASPAWASDREPCSAGMVCASDPQTVVTALQAAGYKAALSKSSITGNPKIESAASGYNYAIIFEDCDKSLKCASLQFLVNFDDDGTNTPELANKWNNAKRFSQMSVNTDKSLALSYDVSTFGGLNGRNFADVIDWWSMSLGEVAKFFKDNPAAAK